MKSNQGFHTVRGYHILNAERRNLTPSLEDYLEMIYRVCQDEGYVRINQLAKQLHVRASSATKVVQKLKELGLVEYEKYGIIQMSAQGAEVGKYLLERHEIVHAFLSNLGVEDGLLQDTELIEHDISENTLAYLALFNQFLAEHPEVKTLYDQYRQLKIKSDLI